MTGRWVKTLVVGPLRPSGFPKVLLNSKQHGSLVPDFPPPPKKKSGKVLHKTNKKDARKMVKRGRPWVKEGRNRQKC